MSRFNFRLTTALLVVGLTAACSSATETPNNGETAASIELVYTYDGELGQPLRDVLATMTDGPEVTLTVAGDSYDDVLTRLAADRTSDKLPISR